ncbi:MAG: DUF488 family protein [bacterium]
MRLYTLGTGNRHPLDFSRVLAKYGIEIIFDIRRLPLRELGFERDVLQQLCDAARVSYVFLGNELGADLNYRTWVAAEPVSRWLEVIRRKLERRAACLLCRELSPEYCRRRALAEKLARADIETVHILDDQRLWRPAPGDPGLLAPAPRPAAPRPAGRPGPWKGRGRDDRRRR